MSDYVYMGISEPTSTTVHIWGRCYVRVSIFFFLVVCLCVSLDMLVLYVLVNSLCCVFLAVCW